jgi:hypothetical protein
MTKPSRQVLDSACGSDAELIVDYGGPDQLPHGTILEVTRHQQVIPERQQIIFVR